LWALLLLMHTTGAASFSRIWKFRLFLYEIFFSKL
jgi:hypothetical protein